MIVIDGKKMLTRNDLHFEIKKKLNLPDCYGGNLDALWDCLTGWVDLPLQIQWKNFDAAEKHLGKYATETLKVFEGAEEVKISISKSV